MTSGGGVISNSSPLIALGRIGRLDVLRLLVGEVMIPPGVAREVFADEAPPSWIRVVPIATPLSEVASPTLGHGEREAIALAQATNASWIILDDLPARRLATSLGLPVIGTVGLLLAAKSRSLVPALAPILDELVAAGFRLSTQLVASVLAAAGESPGT